MTAVRNRILIVP